MPGPRHVRNSGLNRHTQQLINDRVLPPPTAKEVASEYQKIVTKLDELEEELRQTLAELESVITEYMQVRGRYPERFYSDENKIILNQSAVTAMQGISDLVTELKDKVVTFIEYAINVQINDQNESNMYRLQFKISNYFDNEFFTQDKKYHKQHVKVVYLEQHTLTALAEIILSVSNLSDKLNKEPSRKQGISAILFMFNRPEDPELFLRLDKGITSLKKLFLKCSIDENPKLKNYREVMVKFYSSVAATRDNVNAAPRRATTPM